MVGLRDQARSFIARFILAGVRIRQRLDVKRFGKEVTLSIQGAKLRLELDQLHDYRMLRWITAGPGYEPGTTKLVLNRLHPGNTFVDIGANNGYFSVIAGRQVAPGGRVVAAEPTPDTFLRLQRNVNLNPTEIIEAHQVAVGDHEGEAVLYISQQEDGLNSLVDRSGEGIPVRMTTVDSLIGSTHVDLIKIDVEGAELAVLRGMSVTISRNPQLEMVIEWNRRYAGPELFEFLQERFDIFAIKNSKSSIPEGPIRNSSSLRALVNLWCVPKARRALRVAE